MKQLLVPTASPPTFVISLFKGQHCDTIVVLRALGSCTPRCVTKGKPLLWARYDRKPNKAGDKKFQRYQAQLSLWKQSGEIGEQPQHKWDLGKDFKEVPANWITATGVDLVDGVAQPDSLGHTPGWVPVERKSRQYCWHLSAVDLDLGLGMVLCMKENNDKELVIRCVPLSQLCGKTCELIGTNVNGNPYGLGTKQNPLHVLVVHGSIPLSCPSPLVARELHQWFESEDPESGNRVEGVVWHCPSGSLFKLHRHHLNLPWPVDLPTLSQKRVTIEVNATEFNIDTQATSQFSTLAAVNGVVVNQLRDIENILYDSR
ncbi:uncharacterized protein C12orf29 homolog isoform X3 [Pomacea canaliculata]|uniref:uncharacterized protein C12orf29 homolog isoform X3 n=1 Tax=Pomacea canaliculata TaxID=400727 RepID=UPI000D73D4F5|nr:uncharacterized protein C12orf29 homolog isoform X3 [Pomacea canaliculata]